jgi:hypothetical protein
LLLYKKKKEKEKIMEKEAISSVLSWKKPIINLLDWIIII